MNELQHWVKGQRFQDYFDYVVIISEIRYKGELLELNLSFFDCLELNFTKEIQLGQQQQFLSTFPKFLQQLNTQLYEEISSTGKTFILCTYGKDLLLKFIPTQAVSNLIRPQQYFLQFIDLRQELFNFMMENKPSTLNLLNGEFDNLLPKMIEELKIEKFDKDQDIYKQLLIKLLQSNHKFSSPVVINPSQIYGLKLYEKEPWYNKLPIQQVVKVTIFYAKIRGLPYQCTKSDLINFFQIKSLIQDNVIMKYTPNGQFSGESFLKLQSLSDYEDLKRFDKAQMNHRYIEVFNSNFDEFQEASETAKFLIKSDKIRTQMDYISLNSNSDSEIKNQGILKLRGLPWTCTKHDIQSFFQKSSKIKKIKLLYDNQGKPLGQCFVVVKNQEVAEMMKQQYHKKSLGQRYVEIFLCNQREYINQINQQKRSRSRSKSK